MYIPPHYSGPGFQTAWRHFLHCTLLWHVCGTGSMLFFLFFFLTWKKWAVINLHCALWHDPALMSSSSWLGGCSPCVFHYDRFSPQISSCHREQSFYTNVEMKPWSNCCSLSLAISGAISGILLLMVASSYCLLNLHILLETAATLVAISCCWTCFANTGKGMILLLK